MEEAVVDVAAKTNLDTVGVEDFKILLCELKIQAYLGEHPNVLRFLGAVTENIKQREVYMVLEYCPNGNIQEFLVKNVAYFTNQTNSGTMTAASSGTTYVQLMPDILSE
jgi:serine/threonine protein kinase